jgi:alpha-ketoglutarate-dependent taurine dioxygenase
MLCIYAALAVEGRNDVGSLTLERLGDTVGAEVCGVDPDRFLHDDDLPLEMLDALDKYGVLLFREIHLDDDTQVRFSKRLGPVVAVPGHAVPEISVISLNPSKTSVAEYLKGAFDWHIDGTTNQDDNIPNMAGVMSARVITANDGGTEFASTYAAYDDLNENEKNRFADVRVLHSIYASQRRRLVDPTPEQEAFLKSRPQREHPLIWTHRNGRRSLVVGATADYVVGMDIDEGRDLLQELVDRATRPERVYRHDWTVGDLVIWDNRGLLHRACPYDETSPRELHRTTIQGDEPIQ